MTRSALVPLLMAACLLACRDRKPEAVPSPPPAASASSAPREDGSPTPRGDRSIYALSMALTDQNGKKIGLDAYRGDPVFVGMFYGTCPSACPLLISTIKRLMSGLDGGARTRVHVLLVSFDPARDTPDALKGIAARRGLDASWTLASAPEDEARELAALLGIRYRRLPDGNFSHTSSLVLLDPSGVIDARIDDLGEPVEPLAARAEALAKEGAQGLSSPRDR